MRRPGQPIALFGFQHTHSLEARAFQSQTRAASFELSLPSYCFFVVHRTARRIDSDEFAIASVDALLEPGGYRGREYFHFRHVFVLPPCRHFLPRHTRC